MALTRAMRDTRYRGDDVVCAGDALWDVDDLIGRLCGALDFAECAVREMSACEGDAELPAGVSFERLIAETGVLLLAASNVSSYAAVGPRVARVAELLVPHARSKAVLRSICMEPAAAFEHATGHICLNRLGFYDADFDAMLDLSAAASASDGRERAPHQLLAREWLKQGWLYPEGLPRLRSGVLVASSALNRTMDLLHGTHEDVEAFVCALVCLRDVNLFPRPLPRSRQSLLEEAEGLLARCLEQEDYSLAAKVLLAWPLTGETWSAAAAFTFRVVMGAATSGAAEAEQPSNALTVYPPVYALGMLCAACLAERRPPTQMPLQRVKAGALAAVMPFLDPAGEAWWQQELGRLDARERESLVEFLLSIGLHRAARREELASVARLLSVGKGMALSCGPVASQAAEMMVRVSQCGLAETAMGFPWTEQEDLTARCRPQLVRS